MEELSQAEFLAAIVILTALTSTTVFFLLWVFWLRRLQNRIERIGELLTGVGSSPFDPMEESAECELVAKVRLRSGEHTVSIVEEDGKRYLRVDGGEMTDEQRDQMLRYLKDEGFIS